MPRFAANLSLMFNEHAFLDRFEAAAAAGFRAVEFLFPYEHAPEEIADRLTANGLELALFNLPPGDWAKGERGIAVRLGDSPEFRATVDLALGYAAATGCRRLHLMAGLADPEDGAAAARYRDALLFASDRAGEAGRTILIEPLNGRDMPGYFLNDFSRAADLIAELGRANIRLQYDLYHRQILHGDVLKSLEALMPVIGHVQTASVPGRNEPGTGELDDFRVFAALDRLGYDGYVGCEYRPAAGTVEGLGWLERVSA
ncbi:hydroxypyruvate isomerase [Pseudoxanthobacter soli DSM 19599]|uniref:Hydroxypyruvate isomerase n=1 Tax=Pseudoxanthobacter soli DSM 19599 TaxID=1123029 RepID=A0A1M7ZNM6_9HYPH|nr:2-oxo-tetronate isomerase [Pseudoxanthobacter soli]SHO66477.1 hydroxypyruvate isomerase [Pseudoxanthobacter soli DSM 19599]